MATINTSWGPCGSSSDGQFLYYGKTNIVTGTPVSGTGWTLFSGAALPNSVSSELITGLDDNVEYTLYNYCHCTTSGNGPLNTIGPYIKYVCPTIQIAPATFNSVSYTLNVPASANNTGTWIQTIAVQVVDSGGINVLYTNVHNSPFQPTISSNFTGLNPSTNYSLKITYTNSNNTRGSVCSSSPFTTADACTAPVASVSNITANSFDVSWTPSIGGSFDVLLNNTPVATGLTSTNGVYTVTGLNPATIYQVAIRKNCTTGGTAVSNTVNVTTANSLVTGIMSMNAVSSSGQSSVYLLFNFPIATPAPITLYFGFTLNDNNVCNFSNGYDIFSLPSGSQNCPQAPTGDGSYGGQPNYPFVVNIPQGITTYNSGTNIHTTNPSPTLPNNPWQNLPNTHFTDLYVKVNSPSGYAANFSITNGANITGVTIHNV